MRRLFTWLIGVALGGGLVFAAFQFHLVRTDQKFLLVPKRQADWRDPYVDVRAWTFREWGEHPRLSENLIASGHGDIVTRSATDQFFRGLFDSFRGSANPPDSETTR
ncbi:MAG: hypothetical protein ACT4QC_17255 [Planctomycetaceae bacterium]